MCKINLVFIINLLLGLSFLTEAGVLRNKEEQPQSTTLPTQNATTTDFVTVTTKKSLARKNDEEAAILAAQDILFDSSPSELKTDKQTVQVEKSAKLLLLSPPKLSDKNKQPAEENVEEPEDGESHFESNTEMQMDSTTVTSNAETTKTANVKINYEKSETSTEAITSVGKAVKVHEKRDVSANHMKEKDQGKPLIYMKPKEEEHGKPPPEEKPEILKDHIKPEQTGKENEHMPREMKKPHPNNGKENMCPATKAEEPKDMKHSFLHTAVLYEPEQSYVLVQPEPHLQSIFKGIEIIPTFVDHSVGINYVESW
ncbi:uncharacterized protein LOC119637902 [Glossina fuscipes]|uniref:Uncharacterized protein LOC119637902 n=1 Tax=Glossina fuscipes TaxID=7396 RepID=A0A9C5YYH0_9MUSC|nr:uncharacterized protein LOC119637902 [Glossina fuscipes]